MDEELVIAAALAVREIPANFRAGLIDGAAAGLGVDEPADGAEMLVSLMAEDARVLIVTFFGEFLPRFIAVHIEMLAEAFDVAIGHRNMLIGAAIGRAFQAIVLGLDRGPLWVHPLSLHSPARRR